MQGELNRGGVEVANAVEGELEHQGLLLVAAEEVVALVTSPPEGLVVPGDGRGEGAESHARGAALIEELKELFAHNTKEGSNYVQK